MKRFIGVKNVKLVAVVVVTRAEVRVYGGAPTLFINGQPYPPYAYFHPVPIKTYIEQFRDAGVHLFTWGWSDIISHSRDLGWEGPDTYDYTSFDREVETFVTADRECYLFPRLAVSPPGWWYDLHPNEMNVYDDGEREGVSLASAVWRKEAGEALRNLIRHVLNTPYADHFIGFHITGGVNEWFYWTKKLPDFSLPALNAFRRWLRDKYQEDVSMLRKRWGRKDIDFDTLTIPAREERMSSDLGLFRNPGCNAAVADYYQFLSDTTADALLYFCKIAKEETRDKIVGAFYGYLLNATGFPYYAQHWGHNSLMKVLKSPYIDFLCSPYQYHDRGPGGVDGLQALVDMVKLSGKLWLTECDHFPYMWRHGLSKNLKETLEIHKRDFAHNLVRGVGLWWMDLWPEAGWYDHPEILKLVSKLRRVGEASLNLDRSTKGDGVAVIIDAETPFHLKLGTELLKPLVFDQLIHELYRIGTRIDVYLHEALENPNMPEYKLYIFLDTFYLSKEERRIIRERVQRDGKTCVWVLCPGFLSEDGFSIEAMEELVGMKIGAHEVKVFFEKAMPTFITITDFEHPITENLPVTTFGTSTGIGPLFYTLDPNVRVLGKLLVHQHWVTGEEWPGFCLREFPDWRSIYIAAPKIPVTILRNIAKYAGVHIYSEDSDVIYANQYFLSIHSRKPGTKVIKLPSATHVYDIISETYIATDTSEFSVKMGPNETRLFLLGEKSLLSPATEIF
ncbi:MAG: beta-galactosidase [Nitrososphaerota archaeon]